MVGAGPAGSSLAWRLASAGLVVDLLDARAFPRSKPCGDALSPGATPLLREMGVVEKLERAGAAHLIGWRIRTARGVWFTGMFRGDSAAPAWGFAVERAVLDDLLLRTATASGVRFHPRRRLFGLLWRDGRVVGARARAPRGREERFHARLVVGADGLRSRVVRLLGDRVPAGALAHPGIVLRAFRRGAGSSGPGGRRAGNRASAAAREADDGGTPE